MKYTLDLLPINAFQGRGTPVGGRSLRLFGGSDMGNGYYFDQQAADDAAYQAAMAAWDTPAPAQEAAPAAPAPEPAPSWSPPAESAPAYTPEPAPAPLSPTPAPAASNPWEQTVNDIYQQTFGRQADPSGMASFTAALNAGMTGEQMRAALASSPEGQSMGLSPAPAAPVAPLTAAKTAQWEWQPGTQDEFTGAVSQPYWRDVNSGAIKAADPVQYTGVTPVDTNTLPIQTAPNYEGTPTQFYDAQGNLQGVLVDTVRAGLGAKEGSLILDPASLGLALKPGETPSIDSAIQQRNDQGQMLFIDPTTGGTTIYNTGVPAVTGSTVKDLMYINDPGKRGGQIPADTTQGALLLAATMLTGGVGGALLEAAGIGAGAAGGLTAGEASALMGIEAGAPSLTAGLTPEMIAASEAALPGASGGLNLGAAATAAAKTAAINAAVTAAQGGNIGDVLKAGALGAVAGGAGVAGADLLGGGTLAQIGAQTAVATATAAATGKDPVQAALSGALTATLANVVPASTSGVLNAAGITDPSIQKAINSAISSSVITAIRGGDIGMAAIMGAVNSGLTSVAGMIGDTQVVKDLKASLADTISSTVDSIKYELGATNAQALPIEGSNKSPVGTPLDTTTQPDVVNNILQQDVQDVMDRNAPPPLVQAAINQNTPTTLADVVTPPLVQNAIDQSDAERMAQALLGFQNNQTVGAPLSTLVSATTSDINTPTASAQIPVSKILEVWQQTHPDATMSDLDFQDFVKTLPGYERTGFADSSGDVVISPPSPFDNEQPPAGYHYVTDTSGGVSTRLLEADVPKDAPLSSNALFESGFKPQLPAEEYAPMLAALDKAGVPVTQKNLEDISQNPATFVSTAFQAFLGRPPTSGELANYVDQYSESHNTSPQDLLKNIYDQIKSEFNVSLEPAAQTPPVTTTTPPLTPAEVKPEKTPTASASPTSQGNKLPEGGLGTGGAGLAGNEGAPGAVSPSGAAALTEAQNIVSQAASANDIAAVDIPIDTQRLVSNSATLGTSPAQAVASGLVNPDGSLTAKGVKQISDATGLSPSDVVALTNASTTARTDTGSGITSTGAGATTGAATGAALAGTGIGGSTGTNIGGLGAGTGTGVGPGAGTGTGDGSGDGLGLGLGGGSGTGTSGAGTGGVKAAAAPAAVVQPSYSYSGAGSQGTTVGALPGNLQATFLQGANVNEYNPFENYDVYQQLAPIHAAQGGSPLQLAQMQQGISGVDPSLYGVLQKRAAPNYFTYGTDASSGNPTTFAGSQLMGKPTPGIPVIPTGKTSGADWLYQGSGTNPLAMAGTGIASLPTGTMAEGGSAHGEGEHIPEFITGATGHYVRGRGDGQSDDIPAMLADGEYVFDASTVSTLGNGSSDAGAKLLDAFRESLRDHTRSAPADKIPPKASPLEYMKEALQHVGRK